MRRAATQSSPRTLARPCRLRSNLPVHSFEFFLQIYSHLNGPLLYETATACANLPTDDFVFEVADPEADACIYKFAKNDPAGKCPGFRCVLTREGRDGAFRCAQGSSVAGSVLGRSPSALAIISMHSWSRNCGVQMNGPTTAEPPEAIDSAGNAAVVIASMTAQAAVPLARAPGPANNRSPDRPTIQWHPHPSQGSPRMAPRSPRSASAPPASRLRSARSSRARSRPASATSTRRANTAPKRAWARA